MLCLFDGGAWSRLLLSASLLCWVVVRGKFMSCVCSTDHCRLQRTNRCNTTSMCYTQFLQKSDGSDPITRGCIDTKTPLLCENRRPAVVSARWPLLVCCSTNMCNQEARLTLPSRKKGLPRQPGDPVKSRASSTKPSLEQSERRVEFPPLNTTHAQRNSPTHGEFDTVYTTVAVMGVCGLALIVIVTLTIAHRRIRLFHLCCGLQRNSYMKGHRQSISDEKELSLPLPSVSVCEYKVAAGQ
ncbi:uncharacterized protein LOC135399517 [Ornithodoros turicata]|uniref:uncharacterized protein LOC135399517 n=1 Tax=Ornithodoros turicata TaxID=34597 RepID=UPI00313A1176